LIKTEGKDLGEETEGNRNMERDRGEHTRKEREDL
jgi:hypothetical protein